MATNTFSITPINDTDANMCAWIAGVIAAMSAGGLVQTADTGQINTATATLPTVGNAAGYAIFRFNDTLQATAPIFMKVEFGSLGNVNKTNIWVTVGKGTDGAGTVTGVLLARTALGNMPTAAQAAVTAQQGYVSAGDGWAAVLPAAAYNPGTVCPVPGWFLIERSRNSSGAATGDGIVAVTSGNPTTSGGALAVTTSVGLPRFSAINYASGTQNTGIIPVVLPYLVNGVTLGATSAMAAGGIGPVMPWVAVAPGLAPWQCACLLTYPGGDAPGGAFTTTIGGATNRPFLAVPLSDNVNGLGTAVQGAGSAALSRYAGLAIRWE